MLKRINTQVNTNLFIINDKNEKIVVNLDKNGMIVGDYKIWGYAEYLCGNATHIRGDVSNIWGLLYEEIDILGLSTHLLQGDMSKIKGDATGVFGDVDKAIAEYLKKNNLTELDDKIDINLLTD